MSYLVLISEQCRDDAATRGFVPEVERLAKKVEKDQSIAAWDKFLPSPWVKKSLGTFRLIAETRDYGDDILLCFTTFMARGDPRYKQFLAAPHSFAGTVSDAALASYVESRKSRPLPKLDPPSTAEYRYLFDSARQDFGETVYETADWVERVSKLPNQAYSWLFNLLTDQVLASDATAPTVTQNDAAAIAYIRDLPANRTVLIAPFFGRASIVEAGRTLDGYATWHESGLSEAELRRVSRRAYPALVAADVELWLQIESDKAANLALSPEEIDVLKSVVHQPDAATLYPLFINGRPGSGKSTILQYLFAEHLALHLGRPANERTDFPLYLTYSERLLEVARQTVRAIISSNAQLRLLGIEVSASEAEGALVKSFALFHKFVQSKLPPEVSAQFPPERRVTFADFKRLWSRKALTNTRTRAMSPELAWHVLRTYIKGMRDDDQHYFDLEAYAELPTKRRTVSAETFETVYRDVWEGWYGEYCSTQCAWDDQDLTRAALDSAQVDLARHPVVFCDEAQDFTRIELELILKLVLFSRRQVAAEDVKRIPVAFAGDPFQTLNPTGFQWSSVQAGFHEQIVQELDPLGRARLDFNFQELSFNYRSTKGIVGLCNLIQALRSIVFDLTMLRPQQTWFDEASAVPAVFRVDDPGVMAKLKEQEEIVIILPCQEGSEQDFIASDPQLQAIASTGLARNFLSSAAAKGLEFTRVVLYKFGEECVRNYSHLLDPLETRHPHSDAETALPLMYFLNRLYVAASRPKRRLFIIDTAKGIEKFWQHPTLRDSGAILQRIPKRTANGWQLEHLGATQPGAPESWTHDADDPYQLATQFESQGLATRDPYFFALAEANYRRAGQNELATRCGALRMEAEEDYLGAGKAYLSVGRPDDAVRCFWRGGGYDEIIAIQSAASTPEARASRFMVQKPTAEAAQGLLQFVSDEAATDRKDRLLADSKWRQVLDRLVVVLAEFISKLENPAQTFAQLRQLTVAGIQIGQSAALAEIAFAAGDHSAAVALWDRVAPPPTRNERYRQAKAETTTYPERLEWIDRLEDVANLVLEHPGVALTATQRSKAVSALVSVSRFQEALEIAEKSDKPVGQIEQLIGSISGVPAARPVLGRMGRALIRAAIRAPNWQVATEVPARMERLGEPPELLHRELIFQLANSDELTRGGEARDVVATYLRGIFTTWQVWDSALIHAVGAAVERAGKIVDALEYYEEIWRTKRITAVDDRRGAANRVAVFAERRWCKSKYRQHELSRVRGRRRDAEQQRAEADARLLHLGVKITDLEEYPAVDYVVQEAAAPRISETVERMIKALAVSFDSRQIAEALNVPEEVVRAVVGADSPERPAQA